MKGLWSLLLGGTARWLAGSTIIAEPGSAIIAEPDLIVRLCPSHHITGPPPQKCAKLQYCPEGYMSWRYYFVWVCVGMYGYIGVFMGMYGYAKVDKWKI